MGRLPLRHGAVGRVVVPGAAIGVMMVMIMIVVVIMVVAVVVLASPAHGGPQ